MARRYPGKRSCKTVGQKIEIMLAASALRDDQGNLWGGVETFRDIGPFKLIEKERRYLVGMFAHDLKTPVVAVAGLLNRLRQGKVGELTQEQTAYIATIYQEMQRLEKLITSFLDFARLDLHIITPTLGAIQVEKECREVVNRFQALAEAKGIGLQMEFPQEVIVLQADPLLFQRALGNLLENALKYSPPQGNVVLAVHDKGAEVQFALKDQGPGIAPQDLPHLFDLLYRGKARLKKSPGWGWDWPSSNVSSTRTGAASGWKAKKDTAPLFSSPCPSLRLVNGSSGLGLSSQNKS